MANRIAPTAANIISSLGVLGATVDQSLPGYVPVLGEDGKLDAKFIPANAAQAALPGLSDAAFVDPNTDVSENLRKGSVSAPYKTLGEAANKFRPSDYAQGVPYVAFLLAPGIYDESVGESWGNSEMTFPTGWSPKKLYLIGMGPCTLPYGLAVTGMNYSGDDQEVIFQNLNFGSGNVVVAGNAAVTCLGRTYCTGALSAGTENGTNLNVARLRLSADSYMGSVYAGQIEYLSNADRVGYSPGDDGVSNAKTVKEALDRLNVRKIRMSRISGSGSGIAIGSSYDISADDSGGFDVYKIGDRDRSLVEAVRQLYGKFLSINTNSVTAGTIEATDELRARTLSIDALKLGGYDVEIDAYGYLVVAGSIPQGDDRDAVILRDSAPGDGRLWLIGVYDGRLFVERFYEDDYGSSESSSSSPIEANDYIDILDGDARYKVSMVDGRMVIETVNS